MPSSKDRRCRSNAGIPLARRATYRRVRQSFLCVCGRYGCGAAGTRLTARLRAFRRDVSGRRGRGRRRTVRRCRGRQLVWTSGAVPDRLSWTAGEGPSTAPVWPVDVAGYRALFEYATCATLPGRSLRGCPLCSRTSCGFVDSASGVCGGLVHVGPRPPTGQLGGGAQLWGHLAMEDRPGSVVVRLLDVADGDVTGSCTTRVWRKGVLDGEDFPLAEVSDHLEDPDTLVWVDFCCSVEVALV